MNEKIHHPFCVFSWENLITPNISVSKKFYQNLFGWDMTDIPVEGHGTHSYFSINGKEICSVLETQRRYSYALWIPYISVDETSNYIKKIVNAEGSVLEPTSPVLEAGQSAVIKDPTGATFAIWHPRNIGEISKKVSPGTPLYHELITTNLDIAGMFYAKTFNWSPKAENYGDITYIMFSAGDTDVASMMGVPSQNVPSMWITYWQVENHEKSLRKALSLGGKIFKTVEIVKRGHYSIVRDPLGAVFGIMQTEKKVVPSAGVNIAIKKSNDN